MAARVIERNDEDGILMQEVEYYTPLPRIPLTPSSIRALETLGEAMDNVVVKMKEIRITPPCSTCGCDARYSAEGWWGETSYVCADHMHADQDKYRAFTHL